MWLTSTCLLLCTTTFARTEWKPARVVELEGATVTVSEPVKVAESRGFLWFPTLVNAADGRLLAIMSNKADAHTDAQTAEVVWSGDGGRTWGERQGAGVYSECPVVTDGGVVLLPNYLFPRPGGAGRDGGELGAHALEVVGGTVVKGAEPVTVSGFPRKPGKLAAFFGHPELNVGGFVFNGNGVRLRDGRHLVTLYGRYENSKRYDLVVASSRDGKKWEWLASVADEKCALPGAEGPCEAALTRLRDGRLMCVFRMDGAQPYGVSFSSNEGELWTLPRAIGAGSVQPSLLTMKDGTVLLSGGRPGVNVWFNLEGDGRRWLPIALLEAGERTSAYTELVQLDERNVLCIYDRIPHGWAAIPEGSGDVNSVWVVRLTVEGRLNVGR